MSARKTAFDALSRVLFYHQPMEITDKSLSDSDRAFVRLLITTVLRRKGQIDAVLSHFLKKKLPARARKALLVLEIGTAELLFLKTPPHAAISTSVDLMREVKDSFYTSLVNAVLRKVSLNGEKFLNETDEITLNTPTWMLHRWIKNYGKEKAYAIAKAHLTEPVLYLSSKNPVKTADEVGGTVENTGSVRLETKGALSKLTGYKDGDWWVQDKASALPVFLLSDHLEHKTVADLCAAPGGKTAQLLVKGAIVDAFDISEKRLKTLQENLKRLHLSCRSVTAQDMAEADVPENAYDIVLLDAPCSGTGTIQKHPEICFNLKEKDILRLQSKQKILLEKAIKMLKENGLLLYSTCSLEPEEAELILSKFPQLQKMPFPKETIPHQTKDGFLRTFPDEEMTGFFASLFKKLKS